MGNNNNKAENLEGLEKIRLNRAIIAKQISDIDRKLEQIQEIRRELNDYNVIMEKATAEIEKIDQKEIETGIKGGDDKNTVNGKLFHANVKSMSERKEKIDEWKEKLKLQENAIKKEVQEAAQVLDLKVNVDKMSDEEIKQLLQTILQKKDDLEFERLNLSVNTPIATDEDYEKAKDTIDDKKEIKKIREELERLKKIKTNLASSDLKASKQEQYEEEKLVLEAKLGSKQMLGAIENSKDGALLALYKEVFTLSKAETTESGEVQKLLNNFDTVESALCASLTTLYSKHAEALGKFKQLQEAYNIGNLTFKEQAKAFDKGISVDAAKQKASDDMLKGILTATIMAAGMAALGPAFEPIEIALGEIVKAGLEELVKSIGTEVVKAGLEEKKIAEKTIGKTVLADAATAFEAELHLEVGNLAKKMVKPIEMVVVIKKALNKVMESQEWEKLNMEELKTHLITLTQSVDVIASAIGKINLSPTISASKEVLEKHAEKDFWAAWFADKGKDGNPMPKCTNFELDKDQEKDLRKEKAYVIQSYTYLNEFIKTEIDSQKALGEMFKYYYHDMWGWFVDWANAYEAGFYWKDVLKSKK